MKPFVAGFCLDPLGSSQCSPDSLSGFKGGNPEKGKGGEAQE